jgi:regulator of cell morphogenesis and NO signaling
MTDSASIHDAVELTRHVETQYHQRHRAQLPPLVKMAEMVEDLHESDTGVPQGLHDLLIRMSAEMRAQMKTEEQILFPAIRRGSEPGIEIPIAGMRATHDAHTARIAEIRRLTRDLTLPEGACTSWATLYADLGAFIDDLTEHMRLETEVLFPQVET